MTFTALFVEGDNGMVLALAEEFPNIIAKGRTKAEARRRVIEAVRVIVEKNQKTAEANAANLRILGRESLTILG